MFFLYASGLITLTLALLSTLLEALRTRSSWVGGLTAFLGILIYQLLLASFGSAAFRYLLPAWSLSPWEENLAFLNFGLFVIPLFLILDLAGKKHPWNSLFFTFLGFFSIALGVSVGKPDFWLEPTPAPWTVVGFGSFLLCLGLYLLKLLTSLISWKKNPRKPAGLGFLLYLLLLRFFLESLLNLFHTGFAAGASEFLPPLWAFVLGAGLCVLFLRRLIAPWFDPSPVPANAGTFKDWGLSTREAEVAGLLCRGLTTAQAGETLFISEKTVNSHLTNIFRKAGVKNRTQLLTRIRQLESARTGST